MISFTKNVIRRFSASDFALSFLFLCAGIGLGQDYTPLSCWRSVEFGPYHPLAWQAQLQGEVTVKVVLGQQAQVKNVAADVKEGEKLALLKRQVIENLSSAKYESRCASRVLTYRFRFVLEGERTDHRSWRIGVIKPDLIEYRAPPPTIRADPGASTRP